MPLEVPSPMMISESLPPLPPLNVIEPPKTPPLKSIVSVSSSPFAPVTIIDVTPTDGRRAGD